MAGNRRAIVLAIVATDRTFEPATVQGQPCWVGKCIHCQTRLTVAASGETGPDITIEHIVPRNHGGTDELENLALACARCNAQKGYRHDHRRRDDPKLTALIETLKARRMARFVPVRSSGSSSSSPTDEVFASAVLHGLPKASRALPAPAAASGRSRGRRRRGRIG